MSEQLFIRLASQADQVIHWLVWSESENEVIASGELSNIEQLSSLKERAGGRHATVFVPTADILFKTVETPAKISRQFVQALPYMLEEELASDVDELFFAQGKKSTNNELNQLEVAIVNKQKMQTWLNWLDEAGIQSSRILPDSLALPDDGKLNLLQLGHVWLIRYAPFGALSCQTESLDFWLNQIVEQQDATEPLTLCHYSPLPDSVVQSYPDAQAGEYELPLELLAKYSKNTGFNLRQGPFQFKKDSSQFVKIWRNVAIVALVALMVNLANKGVHIYQLEQQAAQLEQQIKQSYTATFPDGKNLSTAIMQKQLKRKLANLGGGGQSASFLSLLEASIDAFATVPDLKPESIRFDIKRGEVRLNASGDNFQTFEKFKSAAEKNALIVEQGSLNNQGSQVVGAISIRSAS